MGKKTYAAVMDDMSKKLSSYQKRYQEAEKRGDQIGIQDFGRRVQRLQAGMETLFSTQEASKPKMGHGGKTHYAEGGVVGVDGFVHLGSQDGPIAYNNTGQPVMAGNNPPGTAWSSPELLFDEAGTPMDQVQVGPENTSSTIGQTATTREEYDALMANAQAREAATEVASAPAAPNVQSFKGPYTPIAQPGNRFYPGEDLGTTVVPSANATQPTVTQPTATQPAVTQPAVTQPAVNAPTVTQPTTRSAEESVVDNPNVTARTAEDTATGTDGAGTAPQFNFGQFMDQLSPKQSKFAQFGQFLPDLYAMQRMNSLKGPVDTPTQTMARMNTDVNYNDVYARGNQNLAEQYAMLDRNIANPVVRAAMKRSAGNQTQENMGQTMTQEINQERGLQNQYADRIASNQNANSLITAQNNQSRIDFENQKMAQNALMAQQMGTKLGQIYGENQNRDLDLKKMGLSALQFDGDLLGRLQENFGNIFGTQS